MGDLISGTSPWLVEYLHFLCHRKEHVIPLISLSLSVNGRMHEQITVAYGSSQAVLCRKGPT